MNRRHIIQFLIDRLKAKTYLEIGVNTGTVLLHVSAPRKIGIDPLFRFHGWDGIRKTFGITGAELYEVTSDEFFEKSAPQQLKQGIDVAFIDGLHTYEQVLRDVENTLQYLNEGGYIILHDCNPLNAAAAMPAFDIDEVKAKAKDGLVPGWNGNWNGDVWKAIVNLRATRSDLHVFVLDLDFGLGVVTKGNRSPIEVDLDELKSAGYEFLEKRRQYLLDLKHPLYLHELLQ